MAVDARVGGRAGRAQGGGTLRVSSSDLNGETAVSEGTNSTVAVTASRVGGAIDGAPACLFTWNFSYVPVKGNCSSP